MLVAGVDLAVDVGDAAVAADVLCWCWCCCCCVVGVLCVCLFCVCGTHGHWYLHGHSWALEWNCWALVLESAQARTSFPPHSGTPGSARPPLLVGGTS